MQTEIWKGLATVAAERSFQLPGTWSGLQIPDRNVAAAAVFGMAIAAASHRLPRTMKSWTAFMGGGWALPLPLPIPLPQRSPYQRRETFTEHECNVDKDDL